MAKVINPKDTTRASAYALWMKAPNPMVTFFKTLDVKNQFIELFSTKKPLDNTNASFQHLCLHVDDVAQAHAELTAKGLALTPVEEGLSKCIKCYLDDPDGNKIELMQLTAESLQTIYDHD